MSPNLKKNKTNVIPTKSSAVAITDISIELSQRDKEILFKGAIEKTYAPGESIVIVCNH
jgi:hypothetical protein